MQTSARINEKNDFITTLPSPVLGSLAFALVGGETSTDSKTRDGLVVALAWHAVGSIPEIVLHPPLHTPPKEKARYCLDSGLFSLPTR